MTEFSIILPVKNGSNYIKECIESILSQTYTGFELLILENASTDDTVEIINSFNDPRIKIITSEKALSIEENWARALSVPKKEYMTLIGHDDILKPDFLETVLSLIDKYPDASLYHTHFNFIDSKGKEIRPCKPMPEKISFAQLLEGFLNDRIDSMGTGYVTRSAHYEKTGGIPVKYPFLLFADFELWLNLTAISYECVSAKNCFSFRVHQSVTSSSPDSRLHTGLEIFSNYLAGLKSRNSDAAKIIEDHGAALLLRYAKSYSDRILRTPKKNRGNTSVTKFIEQTKKLAELLGVNDSYYPEKDKSIALARRIDKSEILSGVFLAARRIYGRPFKN